MKAMTRTGTINGLVGAATIVTIAMVAGAALAARGASGVLPEPPQRLSETGLYLPGTLEIDPRNRPYSPQYPLWSDGAGKSRWVRLPEGATLDVSNVDAWDFPVGTKFWKEFAFDGRRVETRFLWKASPDGWVFASYAWTADQTDAVLAPPEGLRNAATIAPGVSHTIPSREDCRACHDGERTEILGFNTLQLSTDRDPNAPHAEPLLPGMVTLRTLIDEGLARPARVEWLTDPPRVRSEEPVTRAALGYLSANCGHCHNSDGLLAPLGLSLKYSVANRERPGAFASVSRSSLWQIPGAPRETSRVIEPGVPELSALWHRMSSRRPASQMPPLGTALVDAEALALIESWIRRMPRAQLTRAGH